VQKKKTRPEQFYGYSTEKQEEIGRYDSWAKT